MAVTIVTTGNIVEGEYSNVKDTFPQAAAPTSGTVSTSTRLDYIIGVGTVFNTDLEIGDYIWFTTTDEIMKVENITGNLTLRLDREVSGALSGVAFKIIKKRNLFEKVSYIVDGSDADINTITIPANTSKTYGNDKDNSEGGNRRIPPIIIDTTTNSNIVNVSN